MRGTGLYWRQNMLAHTLLARRPDEIKRHIITCGQSESTWQPPRPPLLADHAASAYFALINWRRENNIRDVAISRLEQISPFPYDMITPHLDKYKNADLVYCQEEPLNG